MLILHKKRKGNLPDTLFLYDDFSLLSTDVMGCLHGNWNGRFLRTMALPELPHGAVTVSPLPALSHSFTMAACQCLIPIQEQRRSLSLLSLQWNICAIYLLGITPSQVFFFFNWPLITGTSVKLSSGCTEQIYCKIPAKCSVHLTIKALLFDQSQIKCTGACKALLWFLKEFNGCNDPLLHVTS